ncbi:ABC-three component system protein [Flavobacterium terrae]|uniref:Restriction endonuclease n=1 Tax=Flavobacterium terrae TaxID=415425 RepID=A0A1M6H8C1_9FLAO|nr:ABC-three component system protein [Flavobacterium terrae]SHJ18452.1 Restriction endonuclease [Flavobacterium terrae]
MDYRLELLDEDTFEKLVNRICQGMLGMGVISFAPGKDGGKDGKFIGKANNYPSEKDSWNGKFIVQAKHTANPIASCSDSDFKKTVGEEIKKVNVLKSAGDIDCYLIFTNRKFTGISGDDLVKKIQRETGLENVAIIGKESLNDLYINPNKDIIKEFKLDLLHIPFDFSEEEIKDIILEFHKELPKIKTSLEAEVNRIKFDFDRVKIEEKNKKNQLSKEYYENEILSHSLQDFEKIESFLSDTRNEEFKEQYFDIAAELRNLIQLKRTNFASFEEIFIFIFKKVSDGNKLKGKRHIFTLLHYMYYECLIGVK